MGLPVFNQSGGAGASSNSNWEAMERRLLASSNEVLVC